MGFNINSIQGQIQLLNTQIGFNVNSIQRQIQPLNRQTGFKSILFKDRFNSYTDKWDSTSL